ncbi:MAG: hypothetical protein NT168_03550 [Planctomycetota bacterium]|nr:hypothetical protein [Planctomycetota bacterium]
MAKAIRRCLSVERIATLKIGCIDSPSPESTRNAWRMVYWVMPLPHP